MEIGEFQRRLRDCYEARDRTRGRDATFAWFVEEVGELSRALRSGNRAQMEHEFSDAMAWLVSLATLADIDLEKACSRYAEGCPRCSETPCACPMDRSARFDD